MGTLGSQLRLTPALSSASASSVCKLAAHKYLPRMQVAAHIPGRQDAVLPIRPFPPSSQLWDFRNNKCLFDYVQHTKPIADVAFHPRYYLLVTAALDKTVHVVDLESYQHVGHVGPDTSAPRAVAFDGDARALVAYPDGLRVVRRVVLCGRG